MTYKIWIQSEMLFLTKGGKERPVELPYFIVFGETIGQLGKGDTVQLCSLRC